MQRKNFARIIRISCVLCLSLLGVMLGGLHKPEAAVQSGSFGAKTNFGTGSNPVSAAASTAAQFSQQGPKLVGTGVVGNAGQGYSVSLSAEGDTAIVSGNRDNSGLRAAWVFTDATAAQEPNWILKSPATRPIARQNHAMAYDAARGQMVVFGGQDSLGWFNDTWVWDGTNWTQKSPVNRPIARAGHAMAYDAARGQVVMFGGSGNGTGALTDTWVWDGTNWTQKSPPNSPIARSNHTMTYDAARGQVVLFGGFHIIPGSGSSGSNDTWVWDGTNWTQKANGPIALAGHAMTYDTARGQVVLFGGQDAINLRNDTLVWNGAKWTQKSPPNSPTVREYHAMAYDAVRGQVVLFGGENGTGVLTDTWVWDGTNWTQKNPANNPISRFVHAMAYDAARGQVVLFGGADILGNSLNDTWVFTTSNVTGGDSPATLAKQVVGGDYQSGAKGWDWNTSVFVGPNSIQTSGYHWSSSNLFDVNNVLDCSGLVFWSYNKSFGASKYQRTGNPVYYEGADGQYRNNTVAVSEANLSPGDLMFFHFEGPVGFVSHVAMYVGCCGPNGADVVSASSPTVGITWRIKDEYKSVAGFVGFGRVSTPKLGIRFVAHSPIGLIVTDPEGSTITPDTRITTSEELLREIPGVLYYSESDLDDDGRLGANVSAPTLKIGSYLIQVTPKLDALPTDTYSLDVEVEGRTIPLAQNVLIRDIPSEGYVILSTVSGVTILDNILQDESSGNVLRFNSTTGEYQFTRCSDGFTLNGRGQVIKRGCGIFLQDFSAPDRRVVAQIDNCQNKGTATVQVFALGRTFTIQDRNTSNNTGTCH